MTEGESKQLTEVATDIKWIVETIKEMKQDISGHKLECDKDVDDLKKDVGDLKTKTAICTTKMAMIVSGITFAVTLGVQAIYDYVSNSFKN